MTRKTRFAKPVLSLMLAALMVISVLVTGIGFDTKAAAEYISDGGFETDPWSSGSWSITDVSASDVPDMSLTWYSYASDSYISAAEGDYCFNYYFPSEVTAAAPATVTQNISLPAGTYTFTILSMGGDGGQIAPIIDGSIGTYTETAGWNQWQELTYTITLPSAVSDYTVGFAAIGSSGAWGYVDGISISEAVTSLTYGDVTITPIENLNDDFFLGVDVSSIISLENAGVKFYDFTGSYEQDIFKTLAQAGVNTVRVRVWVDPFNSSTGVGYGGGNNDLATAVKIGRRATKYGLGVLIDFHFSDFWADPSSQSAPKAWSSYSLSDKSTALYDYCYSSLQTLIDAGVDVTMVQIGNETTGGFCGETDWSNMCTLMKSGSSAVRAIDPSILIAVHFTNPEKGRYPTYAGYLNTYGVDYDVFASSYYPYWHGTLTNLTSVLDNVADTYNKKVMVAETSWAYTYTDGDGHSNTINSTSGITETYAISPQGQADTYRAVVNAVNNASNGCGVFWWEPAWIPVNNLSSLSGSSYTNAYNENKTAWETYGCGWASSSAAEYSDDAGAYYGGSSWDNQAMFDFGGTPLDSLMVFNLIQGNDTLSSVTTNNTFETIIPTLTAASGGYNSIALSWEPVEDAAAYEVWYSISETGGYALSATVTDGTTYTHTGRPCNKTCYYMLRAINEYGDYTEYSEAVSATPVPAAPTVKAARASYRSIKVSWNKVTGASGYVVYRAAAPDGTYSAVKTITSGSTVSYTNSSLTCGKTYYYKVRAYRTVSGKKVYGDYSEVVSAYPYLTKPTATISKTSYYLTVKWNKIGGATGYKVYRSTDPEGEFTLVKTITSGATVKFTNTSVVPGVTYYYKVTATKGSHESEASAVKSVTPSLAKPASVLANRSSYNAIKTTWKKVTGASGYVIYRSDASDGEFIEIARVSGSNTLSYNDVGVDTGKVYYYKVAAYRTSGGLTGIGTISAADPGKATLGTVSSFTAKRNSYDSVKLSWKQLGGADGYYIYRATSKSGTYTQHAKVEGGDVLSFIDDELVTGKYFYYKVKGYRIVNGEEVLSASYTAYKSARGTLSTPVVTAKKIASGKAQITVKPIDGADGYYVYRSTSKSGKYTNVTSKCTQTTDENGNIIFTYAGQTKGKTYYYKVRAYHVEDSGNVYSAYCAYKACKV